MKKLLASAVVAASMLGGISVALADPGPDKVNDHNQHGQCTAFFNGQKKGQEGLSGSALQSFYDQCDGMIGGGAEDGHGRYTSCFTDSGDPGDSCSDTP